MKRSGIFHQLAYHFVWTTKNRSPLITPTIESKLFSCIDYKCKELGYRLHALNGTADHVHALISLTPTIVVADVVKNLKGSSSHYINNESGLNEVLYWQDGYGVVTVRSTEISEVARYIMNQKEHHGTGHLLTFFEQIEKRAIG